MRRFYCPDITAAGDLVCLPKAEQQHLFKTLRAKPGDSVRLLNGKGTSAVAEVTDFRELCLKHVSVGEVPATRLHVFVAPPRRQKMDALLKQAAELGVWAITPIICEHSVATPEKEKVVDRWNTILQEGCKQACNPFFPAIELPVDFAVGLDRFRSMDMNGFYGACDGAQDALSAELSPSGDVGVFVGPEGGFSERELADLAGAGCKPLQIGDWTLRVETAVVALAAVLLFTSRHVN